MSRPVLVVRPQPRADRTVARLRELGLDAVATPLFHVEPRNWSAENPARFDALMLTSANALRHGGEGLDRLQSLPVYAVGVATSEAAKARGFGSVWSGADDAQSLAAMIETDGHRHILHLCGEDVRPFAPGALQIERRIAYAAREVQPPEGFGKLLADAPIILLHSPRAASRLAELCAERAAISLVAISANVAEAAGTGWREVAIAANKSDEAIIDLAAQLCGLGNGTAG